MLFLFLMEWKWIFIILRIFGFFYTLVTIIFFLIGVLLSAHVVFALLLSRCSRHQRMEGDAFFIVCKQNLVCMFYIEHILSMLTNSLLKQCQILNLYNIFLLRSLTIPKGLPEAINRRTDNTMAKRKRKRITKQLSTNHYTEN